MLKFTEALKNAGIPEPRENIDTFKMVRWGHNKRYWIRKFEGGYVFGDFVSGLSSHVFEKEYTGAKLKEVQKKKHEILLKLEEELQRSYEQCAKIARRVWDKANIIGDSTLNLSSASIVKSQDAKKEAQDAQSKAQAFKMEVTASYQASNNFAENTAISDLSASCLRKKL